MSAAAVPAAPVPLRSWANRYASVRGASMKFSIDIELGNDAMQTPGDVARALEGLARYLGSFDFDEAWHTDAGALRDVNGNRVGSWAACEPECKTNGGCYACTANREVHA